MLRSGLHPAQIAYPVSYIYTSRCVAVSMRFDSFALMNPPMLYSRVLLAVAGGLQPPTNPYYNLEEKSMKKVCALLIFAGLCAAVLLSAPPTGKAKNDKLRRTANKVENSYIVVLDDSVIGERGPRSIAP